MFIGEFQHTIDTKGRVAIPAKFRSDLSEGAVITRGLDGCLFLYPKNEWTKLARRIAELPISKSNARAFARLMLAGAMAVDFDKQGRVVIPFYLRDYAGLRHEAIITGLFNRLEIWSQNRWEKYRQNTERDSGDIAERLGELGV